MLIGSSREEIAKEEINKIVAAVQPLAVKGATHATSLLSNEKEHQKIIEKGIPEGAVPGMLGRKAFLSEQSNVVRNVYDKRGEIVRCEHFQRLLPGLEPRQGFFLPLLCVARDSFLFGACAVKGDNAVAG